MNSFLDNQARVVRLRTVPQGNGGVVVFHSSLSITKTSWVPFRIAIGYVKEGTWYDLPLEKHPEVMIKEFTKAGKEGQLIIAQAPSETPYPYVVALVQEVGWLQIVVPLLVPKEIGVEPFDSYYYCKSNPRGVPRYQVVPSTKQLLLPERASQKPVEDSLSTIATVCACGYTDSNVFFKGNEADKQRAMGFLTLEHNARNCSRELRFTES